MSDDVRRDRWARATGGILSKLMGTRTPLVPEDYEEQLLRTFGKTSDELADEAERGYDPAKFKKREHYRISFDDCVCGRTWDLCDREGKMT